MCLRGWQETENLFGVALINCVKRVLPRMSLINFYNSQFKEPWLYIFRGKHQNCSWRKSQLCMCLTIFQINRIGSVLKTLLAVQVTIICDPVWQNRAYNRKHMFLLNNVDLYFCVSYNNSVSFSKIPINIHISDENIK